MNPTEIKKLIIGSISNNSDSGNIAGKLEEEGVSFDFSGKFSDKVLSRIFSAQMTVKRESDFSRRLNTVFYRIALTGVAAIVLLLISIFMMEGSVSFNSLIGLGSTYDESILCLLTGI